MGGKGVQMQAPQVCVLQAPSGRPPGSALRRTWGHGFPRVIM